MFAFKRSVVPTLAAGVVLLSSCGGAASVASTPASVQPPASVAASAAGKPAASSGAPAPSAAAAPSKPAAGSATATASGAPIRLGYLTALTGPTANLGKDGVDGTNLYFESVGNTVAGRKIEVVPGDDQSKADAGLTKAKELAESSKVALISGILSTPVCYAVASYAKEAQLPLAVTAGCAAQFFASDPRFQSGYVSRFSVVPMALADSFADWAYKQGFRKVGFVTIDQAGGLEPTDLFAAAWIKRGGSVVQELHPAFATTDFGPIVAQLDPSADAVFTFEPGIDGLRFAQQLQNYSGQRKPKILDFLGLITDPPHLTQLKEAAEGVTAISEVNLASTAPDFQAMAKAWQAKYPDRVLSTNAVQAYASAQIIAAAIEKVKGNVEHKQQFMEALLGTDIATVKGPVKVDKTHEIIQNAYVYQMVKQAGGSIGPRASQTYDLVPPTGTTFTADQLQRLKPGSHKGQWPGMTLAQLNQLTGS